MQEPLEDRRGEREGNPRKGGTRSQRPSREELERVRERDPEALAAFFDRYFERVYGLACRLLSSLDAAQDVTQDVFLKVQRAAHQLDPERDPRPWLTAITYNTCREFWRSSAHKITQRTVSIQERPEVELRLPSQTSTPEAQLLSSERERMVQQAIGDLPEQLRVAVVFHDYDGLGHEEIARLTGISHAAARKRYSRALSELAKRLKAVLL